MEKLAIIVSHPIQHFSPVYQILGQSKNIEVVVIYYTDAGAKKHLDKDFGVTVEWDIDLLSGYRHIILQPGKPTSQGFWKMSYPKLNKILTEENPDSVMLYGYATKLQWQAWNWSRKNNKKILFFSDSTLVKFKRGLLKKIFKELIVRMFFRKIDFFLAVGDRNINYLKHYGANKHDIIKCPLSIDLSRLQKFSKDKETIKKEIRKKYDILDNAFLLLFSGKMIPRKNPGDLIQATRDLNKEGHSVVSIFLGNGPIFEKICKEVEQDEFLKKIIKLPGFINQKELPSFLYASDCYVMSSTRDPHPLSVTEALACGLPVISSDCVGCVGANDTVQNNVNAFVYEPHDINKLKKHILKLMNDHDLYKKMSKAGLEIAKTQDISVAARVIENIVLE